MINIEALQQGNRRALAKSITLVESRLAAHRAEAQTLLEQVLPTTGNSIRIGITGVPGVGKSTFIEAFGLKLIEQGHRVAVLAVDPSSPVTGGSIMGDKTRMERLSQHPDAFIRPSPAAGALGGVAQKTRESLLLCEAAGFDIILVETVGVGQSEVEVAGMVDFFLVLMLPNAGDELQGIKKGILELADAIVVNKADGDHLTSARQAARHYENALAIIQHNARWKPPVLLSSSVAQQNLEPIAATIRDYATQMQASGSFDRKRARQNRDWMWRLVHELVEERLKGSATAREHCERVTHAVVSGALTPFNGALKIMDTLGS